jgi:hypothetical protein
VAKDPAGFVGPVGHQLAHRPWDVLALAGLQGGTLSQPQLGRAVRLAAVRPAELTGQVGVPVLDRRPSLGEMPHQPGRDADQLPNRPLARSGARPLGELHPEPAGEGILQASVVPLRGGNAEGVQATGVERPPLAVHAADLVRHRDMGVQVRITRAGLAMVERRAHQTTGVALRDPAVTGPGERRMLLDPTDRRGDRFLMCGLHVPPYVGTAQRPQQGHRLHRCEHQVEARHRAPLPPRLDRGDPVALRRSGRSAVLGLEHPGGLGDPDVAPPQRPKRWVAGAEPGRLVRLAGRQHRVPVRVAAGAEQGPHLRLGHLLAGYPESVGAAPEPPAGWVPVCGVVVGQRLPRRPAPVHRGDLPGQVGVPVAGGQLVHRHHDDHHRATDPETGRKAAAENASQTSRKPPGQPRRRGRRETRTPRSHGTSHIARHIRDEPRTGS